MCQRIPESRTRCDDACDRGLGKYPGRVLYPLKGTAANRRMEYALSVIAWRLNRRPLLVCPL